MLISHDKKFVFLKTKKTAGTSVEIFFEEFCTPDSVDYKLGGEGRSAAKSKVGVVGARTMRAKGRFRKLFRPRYYNHMPATKVRKALGRKRWNAYFKFTVVRNPYDLLVSRFWWQSREDQRERLRAQDFEETRKEFKVWLFGQVNQNVKIYMIDGNPAVDYFIRFESLNEGVTEVARILGIEKSIELLQNFKGNTREKDGLFGQVSNYYDDESIEQVKKNFRWELDHFGYNLPK
jgi:hypothetical protein